MKIERRFTTEAGGAYGGIDFNQTSSEIRNPDGSVVFKLDDVEIPSGWSQLFLLSAGSGITDGMMAWGDRMLKFTGKPSADPYQDQVSFLLQVTGFGTTAQFDSKAPPARGRQDCRVPGSRLSAHTTTDA